MVNFENDELREEYQLQQLRVRKVGVARTQEGIDVHLAPDVAALFPSSEAVNEALRFLIRITRQEAVSIHNKQV
jgi:hypothetical protein